MKKHLSTLILVAFTIMSFAQVSSIIKINKQDLSFQKQNEFDIPSLNGATFSDSIGTPQLPCRVLRFVIPINSKVTDVVVG